MTNELDRLPTDLPGGWEFTAPFQTVPLRARAEATCDLTREQALDILEKHGLRAHWYVPAADVEDPELAAACDFLRSRGYLITDSDGCLFGKVATARPSSEELATQRRAQFRFIGGGKRGLKD